MQVDGVYDIETENWTKFVIGAIKTREATHVFEDEVEMIDFILGFEGELWAHNGGRYDVLWVLDWLLRLGRRPRIFVRGQRIITLKIGKVTLRDSMALVPMSLEKGSDIGKVKKSKTGFTCSCGESCGGYCRIRVGMRGRELRQLKEYLINDCEATMSMLDAVFEIFERYRFTLKPTIGSCAWSTAQEMSGIPNADWSWGERSEKALYQFARDAYFGGRTQLFQPVASNGYAYDINSAYPAALASMAVPIGEAHEEWNNRNANKRYREGRPGIYRAIVHVPECFCPPLPVRSKLRLTFPWGKISGVWSAPELQYAETMGASIERVSAALWWDSSEMVFAPFCNKVWDLRDKAGPKTAVGTLYKWFANSLTGRLAIRPISETVIFGDENTPRSCPADFDCEGGFWHGDADAGCCKHRHGDVCDAIEPLGEYGLENHIFVKKYFQMMDSAHVQCAAYLTAHARMTLHKQMVSNDRGKDMVYCDTDSIFATDSRDKDIDEHELGKWKFEGRFRDFVAIAPKTYRVVLKGDEIFKSKGVRPNKRNFEALEKGQAVLEKQGVMSLKSSFKKEGSFFNIKEISRSLHARIDDKGVRWYGDRWLNEKDGKTYPTCQS